MDSEFEPGGMQEQAFAEHLASLLASVIYICKHYGVNRSAASLCAGLPDGAAMTPTTALRALAGVGLAANLVERRLDSLSPLLLPVILLRRDQRACVLMAVERVGTTAPVYVVMLPEMGEGAVTLESSALLEDYAGFAILVKPVAVAAGAHAARDVAGRHWLTRTLWRYRSHYANAAMGAALINVLALASTFFTMNVYDRVVPNEAFVTLWSLAVGVALAMCFEFVARYLRAHLIDQAGKKADLLIGTMLFRQAMAIRMEHKPASAGAFANQLREFESVRDFAASATLSVLTDLPFVLMFVALTFVIGGPLGWVPLMCIPLIILVSAAVQWPLARAMQENLRETSAKHGLLIEAMDGLETLKAVGGESFMQRRWEEMSALTAASSLKSRELSTLATNVVTFFQQFETVVIIVIGVYLIQAGELTQGALIGAVMLASRAVAPLGQVVGLAVRYQQAKAALSSLNRLMQMPLERNPAIAWLERPSWTGKLVLESVCFSYPGPPGQSQPSVLDNIALSLGANERVAILGRIGCGKSTLLRLIARLYQPTQGRLLLDGIDASQIDPVDWRRLIAHVGQDSRLFQGSLRQNIMVGRPDANEEELFRVLRLTGLDAMVGAHPLGINLSVGESGQALSVGQRQLVSLARALIARPRMLLLDEPTSAMDAHTEAVFLQHLARSSGAQALVVVTHRPSLLALVERIIVLDQGKVVADGAKKAVLAALAANQRHVAARGQPA